MAKKQKIKNEDPSINFRLPAELKTEIYREAAIQNKTVSNFLRDHLREFMSGSLYEKEIAHYKNNSFINSTEFLQLISWVFSKRNESNCVASDQQLDMYVKTIKRMDSNIPDDLVKEFDKVLVDLVKVRNDTSSYRTFEFCRSSAYDSNFKYELLEKFLLNDLKPYCVVTVPK